MNKLYKGIKIQREIKDEGKQSISTSVEIADSDLDSEDYKII